MTTLGIIQIIYLIINILGLVGSVIAFCCEFGFEPIFRLSNLVSEHLGTTISVIFNILLVLLFLPVITITAAFILVVALSGSALEME